MLLCGLLVLLMFLHCYRPGTELQKHWQLPHHTPAIKKTNVIHQQFQSPKVWLVFVSICVWITELSLQVPLFNTNSQQLFPRNRHSRNQWHSPLVSLMAISPPRAPPRHKISADFSAADTRARARTHALPSNQGLRIGRGRGSVRAFTVWERGEKGEDGKKAEPGICRGKNNRLPKIPLTHPKADKQKYYCFVALVIIVFFCPFLVDQEAQWQALIKSFIRLPCNDGHRLQHHDSLSTTSG